MKSLSRRNFLKAVSATAPAVALGAISKTAAAETILGTPITSLPFSIYESGTYYLQHDLNFVGDTGTAITVYTSNTTIDLNGYTLTANNSGNVAVGIRISGNQYCTVKNGSIRNFLVGAYLESCSNSVVENLKIQNPSAGIIVKGQNCRVEGNEILELNPLVSGACGGALGIVLDSWGGFYDGSHIAKNNTVFSSRGNAQSSVYGGVYVTGTSPYAAVINNRFANLDLGVVFEEAASSSKYRKNLTVNVTRPYVGGTDAQENY